MRSLLFRWPMLLTGIVIASIGCESGTSPLEITGEISFDGKPIKKGVIRFVPTGGEGATPAEGFITDGTYSVSAMPGKYKVEVSSTRLKDVNKAPGPGNDVDVETIPEKYNLNTELTADVSSDSLKHDFTLKSK